jgi:probable rRNA maturation factor
MDVAIVPRQRARRVPAAPLAAFLRHVARRAPPANATGVSIVLAGDATLRRLNRDFRGKDATTDVLSFPAGGEELPDGTRPLGEIIISVPQAARQAEALGHSLAHELRVLVIHGYLHLLGYDHEVDDGTMMRLQARLARALLPPTRR